VVFSVVVFTCTAGVSLCVFTLKLQLEKTNGAPMASKNVKGFFMASTFARKEGPAQWGIQLRA
jgi:hypothetical protein